MNDEWIDAEKFLKYIEPYIEYGINQSKRFSINNVIIDGKDKDSEIIHKIRRKERDKVYASTAERILSRCYLDTHIIETINVSKEYKNRKYRFYSTIKNINSMLNDKKDMPILGEIYIDYNNRILVIDKIDIGNNLGREIQGRITIGKNIKCKDYSCTLVTWADIWRDRVKPQDPSKMKIG